MTMQERGVSRIVSVKFHSDHRENPNRESDFSTDEIRAARAQDNEEVFLAK